MKKSRFTETQIVSILKQADAGVPVKDTCRQAGISRTAELTGYTAAASDRAGGDSQQDGRSPFFGDVSGQSVPRRPLPFCGPAPIRPQRGLLRPPDPARP